MKASRVLLTVIVCAVVAGVGSAYADSRTNDKAQRGFAKRATAYLTISKDFRELSTALGGTDKDAAQELGAHATDWYDRLDVMRELFLLASEMTCKADQGLLMASTRARDVPHRACRR